MTEVFAWWLAQVGSAIFNSCRNLRALAVACGQEQLNKFSCPHLEKSIAFNHRPQRVWQQRVYCHAIKEVETTLTIKLQRRRAGGY